MRFGTWAVLLACCSLVCLSARAEDPKAAEDQPGAEDQSVMSWWWHHSTPVPIVFYTPENQLGLGAGMMTTWHMPGAYADRPSNVTLFGVYTTRKQTILMASHELRFRDDRHVFMQELRFIDWPDRYFGLGNRKERPYEPYTDHYSQIESEYQARVFERLYVGVRHQFRASSAEDLEEGGVLARTRPLGVGDVLWSGVGPLALWDSRKGLFWPQGGSLLRADVTFFQPFLGSDFSATLLRLDLRHYQPLWHGHVLALRGVMHGVVGSPPFQLMPSLGGGLLFRGYYLGNLRDRVLLASEAEYRAPLTTRWALVGFGSVGRVASEVSALELRGAHAAGGAGVRFAIRPENRANFRLDVAYGSQVYVYFQFKEAF